MAMMVGQIINLHENQYQSIPVKFIRYQANAANLHQENCNSGHELHQSESRHTTKFLNKPRVRLVIPINVDDNGMHAPWKIWILKFEIVLSTSPRSFSQSRSRFENT
jgi:hypothetical protein